MRLAALANCHFLAATNLKKKWKIPASILNTVCCLLLNCINSIGCIGVHVRIHPQEVLINSPFTVDCEILHVPEKQHLFAVRLQCPWSHLLEDCYENCRPTCQEVECQNDVTCVESKTLMSTGNLNYYNIAYKYTFKSAQLQHSGSFSCRFASHQASTNLYVNKKSSWHSTTKMPQQNGTTKSTRSMKKLHSNFIEKSTESLLKNMTEKFVHDPLVFGIHSFDFIIVITIGSLTLVAICGICVIFCVVIRHFEDRENLFCCKANMRSNESSIQEIGSNSHLARRASFQNSYYKICDTNAYCEDLRSSSPNHSDKMNDVMVYREVFLTGKRLSNCVEVSLPRFESIVQMQRQLSDCLKVSNSPQDVVQASN